MDAGLTTIPEADIEKHRALAQSLITRFVLLEDASQGLGTALAGTGRRFVSPVAATGLRRSREVELAKTVAAIRPDDPLMGIAAHALLFRSRRGLMVALAVAEAFARATDLEGLQSRNAAAPLAGEDAQRFRKLLAASAFVAAFAFASFLFQTLDAEGEPPGDIAEPGFLFDTPQDALKSLVAGLDAALKGASDEAAQAARAKAFARVALDGLLARKSRFDGLGVSRTRISASTSTIGRSTVSTWRGPSGRSRSP